jgi:hypothetical protein
MGISIVLEKGGNKMLNNFSHINKQALELDLRELGMEILREFFLVSRRLSLDTQKHPKKGEVCKKPFIRMSKLFRVRSYFDFHLYQGKLFSMGISLEEKAFIRGLKSELSRFSLGSVYIYSQVSQEELCEFLRLLGKKLPTVHKKFDLQHFLEEKKVGYIRVKELETDDPFIEDSISFVSKTEDFKVKTLAKLALQDNPQLIQDVLSKEIKKDIDLEGKVRFDLRLKVFQSVLAMEPELHNLQVVDTVSK